MENLFVLHGSFGSPSENWFGWLAEKWTKKHPGSLALVPAFPTPVGQTFDNWAAILDVYRSIGVLNSESAIVAHSSACVFALKYAARRDTKFRVLVTVAGFNGFMSGDEDFDKINSELFIPEPELKDAAAQFGSRLSFFSDDDPHLPPASLQGFAASIGSEVQVIEGGGHLNTDAGYREFPALLEALVSL